MTVFVSEREGEKERQRERRGAWMLLPGDSDERKILFFFPLVFLNKKKIFCIMKIKRTGVRTRTTDDRDSSSLRGLH